MTQRDIKLSFNDPDDTWILKELVSETAKLHNVEPFIQNTKDYLNIKQELHEIKLFFVEQVMTSDMRHTHFLGQTIATSTI